MALKTSRRLWLLMRRKIGLQQFHHLRLSFLWLCCSKREAIQQHPQRSSTKTELPFTGLRATVSHKYDRPTPRPSSSTPLSSCSSSSSALLQLPRPLQFASFRLSALLFPYSSFIFHKKQIFSSLLHLPPPLFSENGLPSTAGL